jgi:hypothetical protein
MDGAEHPAISDEIFYIVPEKCTECVGFYDQEACAAVCPVDCCIPDPGRPESEAALLERAKVLHPEETFAADFPSRFKEKAPEPEATAPAGGAAAPPAVGTSAAAPVGAPVAVGRVEKRLPRIKVAAAPAMTRTPKVFPGELDGDFDAVKARVLIGRTSGGARLLQFLANAAQPLLGAASDGPKRLVERVVGNRSMFSAARATVRNSMLNLLLYPIGLAAAAVLLGGKDFFSAQMKSFLFYGVMIAACEWMIRMREAVFRGVAVGEAPLRGSLYAPIGNPLAKLMAAAMGRGGEESHVGFDGFYDERFDEKTERERRYGEVYRVDDLTGGYLVHMEFPRRVPPSSLADELGLASEMPDYDYDVRLQAGHLIVRGRVVDPRALKLTAVAGAFPPEFTTRIDLSRAVAGFRQRYRDGVLEIALPVPEE